MVKVIAQENAKTGDILIYDHETKKARLLPVNRSATITILGFATHDISEGDEIQVDENGENTPDLILKFGGVKRA